MTTSLPTLNRRQAALSLGALLLSPWAQADDAAWPSKPINLVYPWGPGGLTDDLARAVAEGLRQRLGQPVLIDYKPGATTTIAASHVAHAPKDGYNILFGSAPTFVVNAVTMRDLPYDPINDLSPISRLISTPFYVACSNRFPAQTLAELIAYAKAHPGKVSYSTPGIGSVPHLSIEKMAHQAGIELIHVPYNSVGRQIGDLIAGHVDFAFHSQLYTYIESKQVRGLAYTDSQRAKWLPDLPTVSEVVPGYTAAVWFGLATTAGTPDAIVQRLSQAVHETLKDPALIARFDKQGVAFSPNTPQAFRQQVQTEIPQWREFLKASKLDLSNKAA